MVATRRARPTLLPDPRTVEGPVVYRADECPAYSSLLHGCICGVENEWWIPIARHAGSGEGPSADITPGDIALLTPNCQSLECLNGLLEGWDSSEILGDLLGFMTLSGKLVQSQQLLLVRMKVN